MILREARARGAGRTTGHGVHAHAAGGWEIAESRSRGGTGTRQLVITDKSSQAKDVRAAVGSRYGAVLAAKGHLLDLCEPEDVNPAWECWSTTLTNPEGLYDTKPASGGNKAAKLETNRAALESADRIWLATECDRAGQLIGQDIREHCRNRGEVLRVMFTAQDPQTIRSAFRRGGPNAEHARLYEAAVAPCQADQIHNLSRTRAGAVWPSCASFTKRGATRSTRRWTCTRSCSTAAASGSRTTETRS